MIASLAATILYASLGQGFTPASQSVAPVCVTDANPAAGPTFGHDVGVCSIIRPWEIVSPLPMSPECVVHNFGTEPESAIPVNCWIESLGVRVYSGTVVLPGPLSPGADTHAVFSPQWSPGPVGACYTNTMFTALTGDESTHNDTARCEVQVGRGIVSDTIRVRRIPGPGPTIDGYIDECEWRWSIIYDITYPDLNPPPPPWGCYACFLYDDAAGFVYYAIDIPGYSGRVDYDQFGPYVDEDRSGTWSTDSSEGNLWVLFVGNDDVQYRALLDTTPTVWLYGSVPGAQSASSLTSGHLQFEARVPIGPEKCDYTIQPGDTAGLFLYVAVSGGSQCIGWWPPSLGGMHWPHPHWYGPMIFEDTLVSVEETANSEVRTANAATVARDVLWLAPASSPGPQAARLLDAMGREVMALTSGANDVARLAPGVYFVRQEPQARSRKPPAAAKVVITR